ncbi:MAG TPA: MFS transporter [Steroidobacteraceae bacterium]|jgi:MFS family permease|nr:MFS transporter [Steroidobacteraceae bacterium]
MTVKVAVLETVPAQASASAFLRWYVLLAMCMVYTLSIADRYVISTVLEPIRLELHLTDSGVAFLTGVSLALFYVSFGIPLSLLADRLNRRNLIAVSLIAWSGMTMLCGMAASYWQLLSARVGVGIGEAGGTPAASSIISDYFPCGRRPMALTVFSLGAPIGAWVGADLAGRIADAYGWRAVFLALGVPGIIFGAMVYLTVREPRRGQLDAAGCGAKASLLQTMRFLFQQRSAMHLILASALTALWGWGLTWWTPAFLMRNYGLSPGHAGSITGPIHLIAGTGATVFTGWLLGRESMTDPRRVVWLLGGGIALATVPSIIIFSTHSLALVKAMLWIFIPSIYFYIGPCFGLLNNLAPPRMRAQFCAATLLVANVGNLVIAPQLIGFLSDLFAPGHIANATSLRWALLCLAPTGFWSAYHYFSCARTLQEDQERALAAAR